MTTWIILATGQSMNQELADKIAPYWSWGKCKVATVSDAYKLAPWADALISADCKWWMANPEANDFLGIKAARYARRGIREFRPTELSVNSGLLAMYFAAEMGANKIILLGFDMHGTHYFGPHTKKWGNHDHDVLANTTENRFKVHINEFKSWNGCEVINCTNNSALKFFPTADINDILKQWNLELT